MVLVPPVVLSTVGTEYTQKKSFESIIQAARASARMQVLLTHNSDSLARIGELYGELIAKALLGSMSSPTSSLEEQAAVLRAAIQEVGSRLKLDIPKLVASTTSASTSTKVREALDVIFTPPNSDTSPSAAARKESVRFLSSQVDADSTVVGQRFSTACYITDSFPSLLYLAYKYADNPAMALIANTNVGGENAHRGSALGALLGAAHGRSSWPSEWTEKLANSNEILKEAEELAKVSLA